jgi:hypothetical protein
MTIYILERGSYQTASLGYSYARRAQSVTQTLRWHQVAIIDAENITEAVEEATLAIAQWSGQGFTGTRWRVDGHGGARGGAGRSLECDRDMVTIRQRLGIQ